MDSFYGSSERPQGKFRDLEKLFPERNSDNCNAQKQAKKEIAEGQQPSAHEEPDDVQEERDRFPFIPNLLAKRIQRNAGKFEALQADRKPDNADTPQTTGKDPAECTKKSAKHDP